MAIAEALGSVVELLYLIHIQDLPAIARLVQSRS
jgi:hypothetical protein